jgi:serine/threonine protein phosphatase PrpC
MEIKIRMAAWCAAAGRPYNEDNFLLKDNLSVPKWGIIETDKVISLDEKGALLVVCDGMGGANAGEVASELAVKTIQEWFAPEKLTQKTLASPKSIMRHIEDAINAADEIIKEDGDRNEEHEGMGSTIVLAWAIGESVYVGWCGDSRAYRFNPAFGLEPLTRDHSYVQGLVDKGELSAELAFDHPDSNIITRSLGYKGQKARPDTGCFPLYDNDVIMLCSDGLSGVLRDGEIQEIIAQNGDSMENCRAALWSESENAGWTDNITIALCQIVSGAGKAPENLIKKNDEAGNKKRKKSFKAAIVIAILLVIGSCIGGYVLLKEKFSGAAIEPGGGIQNTNESEEIQKDEPPAIDPDPEQPPVSEPAARNEPPSSGPEEREESPDENLTRITNDD